MGFLSAVDLSELSYWIHHSGVPGFSGFADLSPLQPSFKDNAHRSVLRELPIQQIEDSYEKILIPMAGPAGTRCLRPLAVKPLYEALAEQFAEDPRGALEAASELRTANWLNNPIRSAAPANRTVLPYGHFVDAAQFRGKGPGVPDSIISYNVNLGLLANRYVVCTMRKEHLCGEAVGCPCRGRCSLEVIERYLVWCAEVAASGLHPEVNFLGQQFESLDRRLNAGQPICAHGESVISFALVEFRADGAQYSDLGLRRTNQDNFCLKCHSDRASMFDFVNAHKWMPWTDVEYQSVVTQGRLALTVPSEEADAVLASLHWDFRENKGLHARIVKADGHGLQKHDILVYGGSCWNQYAENSGDLLGVEPYQLLFWRPTEELRCPLYVLDFPGCSVDYLMLDDLHNLDLGCAARIAGVALLGALKSGRFGHPSTERGMKQSVAKLNADLHRFFKGTGVPWKRLTIKSLCWKNMQSKGHLKAKGFHCSGIMPYVIDLLESCDCDFGSIRRKPLLKAAIYLQRAYRLMRESPREIDHELLGKYLEAVGIQSQKAGVPLIPKFHYLFHFGSVAAASGNPRCASTRIDESLNADVVRLAQSMHTSEFSARMLSRQHLHRQVRAALAEAKAAWLVASKGAVAKKLRLGARKR